MPGGDLNSDLDHRSITAVDLPGLLKSYDPDAHPRFPGQCSAARVLAARTLAGMGAAAAISAGSVLAAAIHTDPLP